VHALPNVFKHSVMDTLSRNPQGILDRLGGGPPVADNAYAVDS